VAGIEPLPSLDNDGLPAPEIGGWGEEKYRHVQLYSSLFARSMRRKWDALFYLDLFAGSGRSRIRGTARIVNASPLLILGYLKHTTNISSVNKIRILLKHSKRGVTVIFLLGT